MDLELIDSGNDRRLGRWLLISDLVGALAVSAIAIALIVATLT
jgi:hypothetical protein